MNPPPPPSPPSPPRPSPRRELQLQGPRPAPLKVSKGSHKIRKPPPHPAAAAAAPPVAFVPREPLIIYAVSPKVIHTNPADFMALVQSLTGPSPRPSAAVENPFPSPPPAGAISPAAKLASVEKYAAANPPRRSSDGIEAAAELFDQSQFTPAPPGILSPFPSSLPPISPGFFSPSVDANMLSFLHELSPAFHGNKSYIESTFMTTTAASPHGFLGVSPPVITSPGGWDLFNPFQFQDF